MYFKFFLLLLLLFFAIFVAQALIHCSNGLCELHNYFGGPWPDRIPCIADRVFFPETEAELVEAVSFAVRHKHKIKVVSSGVHSHNKISCPNSGSRSGIIVSTSKYNSSVTVDRESMTVTADAGVGLRRLIDRLASEGFALQHSTMWDGVSVSGMISTGAHGSGLWGKGGGTHEYVVGLRIVVPASEDEGFAKVLILTDRDEESFDAARISLGVLGAISQVTFSIQPMFKRSVTQEVVDDSSLEAEFVELARMHEFGEMFWYPTLNKFVLKRDDRVASDHPGNGLFTQPPFDPMKG